VIPDDDPLLLDYAAAAADLVWRLLPHLEPRTEEERDLVKLERRIAATAARMTARGFVVDTDQVRRARAWCDTETTETMPALRARGILHLGAARRGRDQAIAALRGEGAALTKLTASGAIALDCEVLDGLTDAGFTTAGWLRRARRADRYRRDYLNKMLTNRGTDGRLRPEIRTLGTRTGRWAVGGAIPLQQIPTTGRFRACLVPDDGRVLVSYDYDSIEFVTLAALTANPGMLAVLRAGADPHLTAADVIWPGTALLAVDDPERARRRKQAKQFTHGLGYGMGPKTLAARSGLSLAAATTARDRLRRAWPGASRAMDTIRRGYWRGQRDLRSPFGRPYRIPPATPAPSSTARSTTSTKAPPAT
jgi:DNA polymerase-1